MYHILVFVYRNKNASDSGGLINLEIEKADQMELSFANASAVLSETLNALLCHCSR